MAESEIQAVAHKHIATALGYHCGLGDKDRCNGFTVIEPIDFNVDKWIRARLAHGRINTVGKAV